MRLLSLLVACALTACGSESSESTTIIDAAGDTAGNAAGDAAVVPDTSAVVRDDAATPTPDSTGPAATFTDVYDRVLSIACSSGYCHGGGQGGWTFSADRGATYAELVGTASARCSGLKKVEPGQPERSALYLKLRGNFMGVCTGNTMPPTEERATAAQLEIVRSWIAAGAKP